MSKLCSITWGGHFFMHAKRFSQYLFLWTLGGSIYYLIEIIYRGFSHWSMFGLGGICFLFFYLQGKLTEWSDPIWIQILRSTIFVVSCEFITGIIVNKCLNLEVWDYSDQPFQILGQICLPFAILFSVLCAFGIILSGNVMHWIYGEKKPSFHLYF